MKRVLLIGGTDPSGAGLQTDWQVAHHLNVHASSVVSAVTSQNNDGVFDQGILPYEQIKSQLDTLKNETFAVIKIGMLGNAEAVRAVVDFIQNQSSETIVILDPVLSSSSGGALINEAGQHALIKDLLPLTNLVTPNSDELQILVNTSINDYGELEKAAQQLLFLGAKNVLVKGGHFQTDDSSFSTDFFINNDGSANIKGEEEKFYLKGSRWKDKNNVRGTGCSLATAVACKLSQGFPLNDSIVYAKALISNGIRNAVINSTNIKNTQQILQFAHYDTQHPFELIDMPRLVKNASMLSEQYEFLSCDSKKPNNSLGIYPVVDSLEWLKKLIPLGVETIQLRIKDQKPEDIEDKIVAAIKLGHEHNIRLFINDYWLLAIKHKAYGIHLGQEDLDGVDMKAIAESACRLGVSTHNYTEVARALQINPSYLALGPIFSTTSKIMPWVPQGETAVRNWVGLLNKDYPLVAIGGINYQRAEALKQTGIGSVAMISEITKADNYEVATQSLLRLWDS